MKKKKQIKFICFYSFHLMEFDFYDSAYFLFYNQINNIKLMIAK